MLILLFDYQVTGDLVQSFNNSFCWATNAIRPWSEAARPTGEERSSSIEKVRIETKGKASFPSIREEKKEQPLLREENVFD
jgi:hypothetical protein